MKVAAAFLGIYAVCWVMISLGQSAASGKPLSQCLMSSHTDCGIPRVDCPAFVGGSGKP